MAADPQPTSPASPGGAQAPLPNASGVYTLTQYAAQFNASFPASTPAGKAAAANGQTVGSLFLLYRQSKPHLTDKQAASAYADILAVGGFDTALGAGVKAFAQLLAITPAAVVAGTQPVAALIPSIPNPLAGIAGIIGALGQPAFWVRAGKVVVGLVLITAGVMHITGMSKDVIPVIGAATKVVP